LLVAAKRTLDGEDRSETMAEEGKADEWLVKDGPVKMAPSHAVVNNREFAAQLSGYTGDVVKFGSNLAAIESAHNAALKVVEEEKKKDLDRKRGKSPASKTTASTADPKDGPVIKDGKPVFGAKNAASGPAAMNLFDARPEGEGTEESKSVAAAGPS
jgi:hypothetical protein